MSKGLAECLCAGLLIGIAGAALPAASAPAAAIRSAVAAQAAAPDSREHLVALAGASLDQVRHTNSVTDLARAERLIDRLLREAPDEADSHTLDARRLMVAHRFTDALAASLRAEALGARDAVTLSMKADALVELGRYDEAEVVIQQLLDQHPGPAALSRAAHFRFLHGDVAGAIELAAQALRSSPAPSFDHAWLALQVAELLLVHGQPDAARHISRAAEADAPAAALALQARISQAAGRPDEADDLLRQAIARQLRVEDLIERWRLALARHDPPEITRQTAVLQGLAALDEASGGRDRRLFASWYADQTPRLPEAERLARAELAVRPDIFSHALLAWILHRQGRNEEARPHAEQAIARGTPDWTLRRQAGLSLAALGDPRAPSLLQGLPPSPSWPPAPALPATPRPALSRQ